MVYQSTPVQRGPCPSIARICKAALKKGKNNVKSSYLLILENSFSPNMIEILQKKTGEIVPRAISQEHGCSFSINFILVTF